MTQLTRRFKLLYGAGDLTIAMPLAIIAFYQEGRSFASQGTNKQLSLLMRMFVGSMLFSLWWLLDTTAGSFFAERGGLVRAAPHRVSLTRLVGCRSAVAR